MKHPLLNGFGAVYYGLVWLIVIVMHAMVLHLYHNFSWLTAIQDSLVFNDLFAALGLGIWYLVYYSRPESSGTVRTVATLLIAGLFILGFWSWLGTSIMHMLSNDVEYLQFLDQTRLWRVISGGLFYALMVLIYYLLLYHQNLRNQERNQLQLSSAVKEAELRMLKSQINPHFIFNSLNSISSLTLTDPSKAQKMIINLSNFLRYSIGKDNQEKTAFQDEIDNIQLYMAIEKIRFGNRLEFVNKVPENCKSCMIPNLILQPLIENAIKHGVQESIQTISIELTAEKFPRTLKIWLVNNFDPDAIAAGGTGIGLKNISQRLSLIYGSDSLIQYHKEGNLFKVQLEIPQ